jgi:hypothetical protein
MNFVLWSGGLYEYPMKNISRTAKFLPTWGLDNTFDLNPKWVRTLQSSIYFSWDIHRDPPSTKKSIHISNKGNFRAFNWLKCLCGFLHLKPTAGCQISTLMQKPTQALRSVKGPGNTFDLIPMWWRTLSSLIYFSWDIYTDLSAWVGFCISSPQLGVKYQLWYFILFLWRGVSINIPWKIY